MVVEEVLDCGALVPVLHQVESSAVQVEDVVAVVVCVFLRTRFVQEVVKLDVPGFAFLLENTFVQDFTLLVPYLKEEISTILLPEIWRDDFELNGLCLHPVIVSAC